MAWMYLIIAIVGEVIATSSLKAAEGFTKIVPSAIAVTGYGVTFYFLSLALKNIPLGIAYAVWCGVGIVFITLIGFFFYKQTIDLPAAAGMALIFTGVFVIYLLSKSIVH